MGVGHEDRRRVKILPRRHGIAEEPVIDTHDQTCLVILVQLRLCQEAPGIHQGKAIAGAELLGRRPLRQRDEGILLVRGDPAPAPDLVDMVGQRLPLHLPLLAIPAGQGDQVQIAAVHIIHVKGHDPLEQDLPLAAVVDPGGPHDDDFRTAPFRRKKEIAWKNSMEVKDIAPVMASIKRVSLFIPPAL